LYDCVDSLGVLETEEYSLITNFPKNHVRKRQRVNVTERCMFASSGKSLH
ncbi:unnamed protein product, partial [Brassica oleracea]